MKQFLKSGVSFVVAFFLSCSAASGAFPPQSQPHMSVDDQGFVTLEWLSLPGRTYFMQCSFDLTTWTYFGEVIHSGFGIERVTFDPDEEDHVYFRIICAEIPTYDAPNDDFDNDGLSNEDEVINGTDPFVAEPGTNPVIPNVGLVAGHLYTLEVEQTGGDDPGTREYHLDRDYRLLTVPGLANDPFPIGIAALKNGAETKIRFKSVNPVTHDTPIDLIFYKLTPDPSLPPGESAPPIPGLEKIPPLIIPSGFSSITSERVFQGSNANQGFSWFVAPFVIRGIDQTQDPPFVGSWDSGVDKTSRRATADDLGSRIETWIMAPGGGGVNQVEIEANAPFELDLSCLKGNIAPSLLQEPKDIVALTAKVIPWLGILEGSAPIKLGAHGPNPMVEISTCVKIKSVKRREITVNVYPISSAVPGEPNFPPSPPLAAQEIQDYFDRVYFRQINLKCQINLHPISIVGWDTTTDADYGDPFDLPANDPVVGDFLLDVRRDGGAPEVNSIIAGRNLSLNEVHLFIMGGCNHIREIRLADGKLIPSDNLRGFSDIANRRCFVTSEIFPANYALPENIVLPFKQSILNTMVHEIGHVLITGGHPDSYNPGVEDPNIPFSHNGGPAPLARDPDLHQRRLMASGNIRKSGIELVLEEWNQIIKRANDINPASNDGN